ncbi:uncharacterized protein LOC18432453 [Amborella trichopoda]|uniref:Ycf54-like protein n=1 Tax=Amborella trichopoda TaxID=13333 RepID=W1P9E3_AMBTC|nr:uncharacterized protein LOC18432453 [Amborella trichopoda]ERN04294.1 hypothetical protein AMTR_s00077p00179590 [Amborella trichopoda]|eukprot:XP_006842619.1 uncharacterized protein LOC18432453 [Amborella trichopoda]
MAPPSTLLLRSCSCLALSHPPGRRRASPLAPPPNPSTIVASFSCYNKTHQKLFSKSGGSALASISGSANRSRALAVDSDQRGSAVAVETEKKAVKYHFVVANAKFMLDEEEHFKELLCERLRLYGERQKEQDFWLVIEPNFLQNFPKLTARLKRPAVALVSTNATWITFMKLRLDRVLSEQFEAESLEEALASNPVDLKFEKPENWVAPYSKYEYGWWEPFLPPQASKKDA